MAFSTIKNKFWWGGGVVFRNRKWCFWRIWDMFSASKSENSHSVAPILPFCRAEMVASYLFVVDKLRICRIQITNLSQISSIFVVCRNRYKLNVR